MSTQSQDSNSSDAPLRVGIAGLGTVAQGVLRLLQDHGERIAERAGRAIVVTQVASRRLREEAVLGSARFNTDVSSLASANDVDVVVELVGGDGVARELVTQSLRSGRSVVTANKALVALHADELIAAASVGGAALRFEAAVAGGIPVIGALQQGLAANRIDRVVGIINGTGNFILSKMSAEGAAFADVLAEAQALGYAEADPTFDVEGIDAAHKLAILAHLAFDMPVRFDAVYCEGISTIEPEDIEYARELGYVIKHLGIARASSDDASGSVELRVHPTLVPSDAMLAQVNGVMNAVLIDGHAAGPTLYYGAGAGGDATASAVVSDLVALARGGGGSTAAATHDVTPLAVADTRSGAYLKIPAQDRPGVMAEVASVLSRHAISIESVIQRERAVQSSGEGSWVPIVILTNRVSEASVDAALAEVAELSAVTGPITRIRVEHFDE